MVAASFEVVQHGRVVDIADVLRKEKRAGLERSHADDPIARLHGAENIVRGLEKALTGHNVDKTFEMRVSSEDGDGARDGKQPRRVPRSVLPRRCALSSRRSSSGRPMTATSSRSGAMRTTRSPA